MADDPRSLRRETITVKIIFAGSGRYRVSDLNGKGIEFRGRRMFKGKIEEALKRGEEVRADARLSQSGRWLISSSTLRVHKD
jgi:hypothetical protein